MKNKLNSTTRFSNRVENYARYRPSYPQEILDFIGGKIMFDSMSVTADFGSGTGIFTEILLQRGGTVYGIEPNREMREYAEGSLKKYKNFISVNGTAENTGLNESEVDLITVAQAFHWFDREKTRDEMRRVLKENGYLFLIWNDRKITKDSFSEDYENMIAELCPEYKEVTHKNIDDSQIAEFYSPNKVEKIILSNSQYFDFEELKGRLMSSSYVPVDNDKIMDKILNRLRELFDKYSEEGKVCFEYETTAYLGKL